MKNVALLAGLACFTSCSTYSGLPPVGAEVSVSLKSASPVRGVVKGYTNGFLAIDRADKPKGQEHIRVMEIYRWRYLASLPTK
tara:strand:- start:2216 stop:2464 length:249 start_codon:yes stop_codon:yes gene_type:complete